MSDPAPHRSPDDDAARRSPDAGNPDPWDASWLDERSGGPPRLWRALWAVALAGLVLLLLGWTLHALSGSGHDTPSIR